MPTTSGTGSEVTNISVVTDSENHRKVGVIGSNCIASLAVVDPELTAKMPPQLTAATGMDAFSHAAEALTSGLANPLSDALAEKSIALVSENLAKAVKDGLDLNARTNMALASMMAGVAFKDGLPHLGHAIAHTLGSQFHIHHGVACALALPGVMEYAADVVPDKVRSVGKAMGLQLRDDLSGQEVGTAVADAIRRLNTEIGIPSLKDLGVEPSRVDSVADAVLKDDCANFVPKAIDQDLVVAVLRKTS
jgi:alcohol dehydrogenase class IV